MLIDPRCIPEVLEKLKPDEFYVKLNRDIYETMYAMFSYGQTIDPVTVLDQMKVRGVYQENNDAYVAEVMRVTPTAANVMEYAAIVRDRALLRRLGEAADEINSMVYEGSGEAETMLEAAELCLCPRSCRACLMSCPRPRPPETRSPASRPAFLTLTG